MDNDWGCDFMGRKLFGEEMDLIINEMNEALAV